MTGVVRRQHGHLPTGEAVEAADLVGERISLSLSAFGARITRLLTPDRSGAVGDVVLGYDDLAGYLADRDYHGATVGRYANRIGGGRFELDGRTVDLERNEARNTLHGGASGFHAQVWSLDDAPVGDDEAAVVVRRTSPDGEGGFPGRLDVSVRVAVRGPDVVLTYEATTDAPTVVGLTQHAYLNLAGGGTVDDHVLLVDAARYLPVGEDLLPLPSGPEPVQDSVFDLRSPTRLGDVVRRPELVAGRGLDHCYLPDGAVATDGVLAGLRRAARLEHPGTGRWAEVWTDQPGVQVYSGGWLDGSAVGRGGRTLRQGDGLCLEPQSLPDTPNRPEFGSAALRPGETYRQREVLRTGAGSS